MSLLNKIETLSALIVPLTIGGVMCGSTILIGGRGYYEQYKNLSLKNDQETVQYSERLAESGQYTLTPHTITLDIKKSGGLVEHLIDDKGTVWTGKLGYRKTTMNDLQFDRLEIQTDTGIQIYDLTLPEYAELKDSVQRQAECYLAELLKTKENEMKNDAKKAINQLVTCDNR